MPLFILMLVNTKVGQGHSQWVSKSFSQSFSQSVTQSFCQSGSMVDKFWQLTRKRAKLPVACRCSFAAYNSLCSLRFFFCFFFLCGFLFFCKLLLVFLFLLVTHRPLKLRLFFLNFLSCPSFLGLFCDVGWHFLEDWLLSDFYICISWHTILKMIAATLLSLNAESDEKPATPSGCLSGSPFWPESGSWPDFSSLACSSDLPIFRFSDFRGPPPESRGILVTIRPKSSCLTRARPSTESPLGAGAGEVSYPGGRQSYKTVMSSLRRNFGCCALNVLKKGGRWESEREQSAHALPLQRMKILKRGPSADACVSGSSVTDLVTVFCFLPSSLLFGRTRTTITRVQLVVLWSVALFIASSWVQHNLQLFLLLLLLLLAFG